MLEPQVKRHLLAEPTWEVRQMQTEAAESLRAVNGSRDLRAGGVIIAGGSHGSVGIARSLGRRGVPVWMLSQDSTIHKVCRYVLRSPAWPANGETERVALLLDLADRYGLDNWTLFPGADAEVELLSRHWTALNERFRLTTPPWEVTRWAFDKRLTYQRCAELQIDHPWTRIPSSREELCAIDCRFPAVLKPAYRRSKNAFTQAKAWRVDGSRALLQRFEAASLMVEPGSVILQEMIPGGGEAQYSYAALCLEGKPVASLVARRARQYPVDFGYTSTFVETVDCPEIEQAATRFLKSIHYSGLVEVEFKYDSRDRRYKLLDVNPRVWTWHTLGRRAGVDFPYLQWLQAHGRPVPQLHARTGVRWVLGMRDLVAALLEIRRGKLRPTDYLRSLRPPIEFGLFAADDPLPAMKALTDLVRSLWKGRIR